MRAFSHIYNRGSRESLDTERITFTMFNLWLETIEYDTIAKLNENSWSPGCRTI
jgi:hypothetical protein